MAVVRKKRGFSVMSSPSPRQHGIRSLKGTPSVAFHSKQRNATKGVPYIWRRRSVRRFTNRRSSRPVFILPYPCPGAPPIALLEQGPGMDLRVVLHDSEINEQLPHYVDADLPVLDLQVHFAEDGVHVTGSYRAVLGMGMPFETVWHLIPEDE